jgi:sugar lactone lactonase YvrE
MNIRLLIPIFFAAFTFLPNSCHAQIDGSSARIASDSTSGASGEAEASGIISTIAGDGFVGQSGNGGPARQAQLINPESVAVDQEANVYIADPDSQVIRKISASTGMISIYAGSGVGGYSGDGGPATKAKLNLPSGLAFDSKGNLYVNDTQNNRIRKIDASTGVITTVAGTGAVLPGGISQCNSYLSGRKATETPVCFPIGIAFDKEDDLYIAEPYLSIVRKVDAKTGILTTIAGSPGCGNSGDGGPATKAKLFTPFGVALDAAEDVYILDGGNCDVRKVAARTGIITTFLGRSEPPLCWLSGLGGPASAGGFSGASGPGIAIDSKDNFYIAASFDSVILAISASDGNLYSIAGTHLDRGSLQNGLAGYSGDGGPAIQAKLCQPRGLALDPSGNLYIADSCNSVIRKVTRAAASF